MELFVTQTHKRFNPSVVLLFNAEDTFTRQEKGNKQQQQKRGTILTSSKTSRAQNQLSRAT